MPFFWLRTFALRLAQSGSRSHPHKREQRYPAPQVEILEVRDVPAVVFTPDYVLENASSGETPLGTTGPTGYTPAQIEQAYGFNKISMNGAALGTGTTIAIVDAYSDPTITTDLQAFDKEFGLANPTLTVVNQSGGTTLPAANADWAGEISLDVEWAHAIAPGAKILLVEATNSSENNLFAAVQYAAKQSGVVAVSMSWGGSEFAGETSDDSVFTPPASNPDVVFVNSSGDEGAPASYPSTSPNVLSVGGTTLNLTSSGSYSSETGWSGSGGGISAYEPQPSYQKGIVTQSTTKRTSPDVAYDADPNTGFPVYQTYGNSSTTPWLQYGGTSDAAPQWSALIAIADQGRALAGESALSSSSLLKDIYSLPSSDFRAITSGTSDGSPPESATAGYNLVTGRGTPVANLVVAGLVGSTNSGTSATHFSISSSTTATAGTSFTITVTALNASNQVIPGYTGTVDFTSSDGSAVLPANYTFTASNDGIHTFTVTLKTAGTQSITATDTSNSSTTGTESGITVNPGAATHLGFLQQPSSSTLGGTISPAVTVEELDQYGNVVTTDSTTKVTLSLGSNSSGATLSGGGTVTLSHGIATFSNLSVNVAGTGYTLTATSGSLTSATSSSFNVTTQTTGTLLEGFENGLGSYYYVGGSYPYVGTTTQAAHNGTYGLEDEGDGNWYFRTDSAAQVNPGDSLSVWVQFAGSAAGRSYFGFGTTFGGTLSVVLAPNTDQFLIQSNAGFSQYLNLAATNQTYSANQWYRVEVDWGTSGTVVAKLFASNGTTLLNSVTAATGDVTSGGFAFRSIGSVQYFDTVTVIRDVNNFAALAPSVSATPLSLTGTSLGTNPTQTGTSGSGTSGSEASGSEPTLGLSTPPATSGSELSLPWTYYAASSSSSWNPYLASESELFATDKWFIRVG